MLFSEVTAVGVVCALAATGTTSMAAHSAAMTIPNLRTDMDPPGSDSRANRFPAVGKRGPCTRLLNAAMRRPALTDAASPRGRAGERGGPPLLLLPPFVRNPGLPGH